MKQKTTNVSPAMLNYDQYTNEKYDRDIVTAIPYHRELHREIARYIETELSPSLYYDVLDLGVGTGITSKLIQDLLPNTKLEVIDFSRTMLQGAKKKLGTKNVAYHLADYSKFTFEKQYDLIVTVIGLHHQTHTGKQTLFKTIFEHLKPGGIFLFGDLITYRDQKQAALNHALHFHHMVQQTTDEATLADWAHHHMYLNNLAPIEDQLDWLASTGFTCSVPLVKMNTAIVIAKKPVQ